MWNRIEYADWVDAVPVIAFVLTFSVFLLLVIRAFLLRSSDLQRLAKLPLEDTPPEGRRRPVASHTSHRSPKID